MFKVGDRLVCTINLYSAFKKGDIVIIKHEPDVDGYFTPEGVKGLDYCYESVDFVLEEVYNSPLFRAMKEIEDEIL